jgi:hypothetical protein
METIITVLDAPVDHTSTGNDSEIIAIETNIVNKYLGYVKDLEVIFDMEEDNIPYVRCVRNRGTSQFRAITTDEKSALLALGFRMGEFSFKDVIVPSTNQNTKNYMKYFEFVISMAVRWTYFHTTRYELRFRKIFYNEYLEKEYHRFSELYRRSPDKCLGISREGFNIDCSDPPMKGNIFCRLCSQRKMMPWHILRFPKKKTTTTDFVESIYRKDRFHRGYVQLLLKKIGEKTGNRLPNDVIRLFMDGYYANDFVSVTLNFVNKLKNSDNTILDDIVFPGLTKLTIYNQRKIFERLADDDVDPHNRYTVENRSGVTYRQLLDCYVRVLFDKRKLHQGKIEDVKYGSNSAGYIDDVTITISEIYIY